MKVFTLVKTAIVTVIKEITGEKEINRKINN